MGVKAEKTDPVAGCLRAGDLGGVPYEVMETLSDGYVVRRADGQPGPARIYLSKVQMTARLGRRRGRGRAG